VVGKQLWRILKQVLVQLVFVELVALINAQALLLSVSLSAPYIHLGNISSYDVKTQIISGMHAEKSKLSLFGDKPELSNGKENMTIAETPGH